MPQLIRMVNRAVHYRRNLKHLLASISESATRTELPKGGPAPLPVTPESILSECTVRMSFAALDCSKISFGQAGASLEAARSLAQHWASAFTAGDLDGLLELYDPAAALFASPAAEPIVGAGALRRFFGMIAGNRPVARLVDEAAAKRLSDRSAFVEGHFEFARGEGNWIRARYRFLLVRHIRSWRIAEHHSATMPLSVT